MNLDSHILTECHIDTLLVKTLSPTNNRYNHQKSCNNVLKTMHEKYSDKPAFGIIDNDKDKQGVLKKYICLKKNELLSIYKIHKDKPHYIVTIGTANKAIENFILENAKKCGICLSDYDLQTNLEELKNVTKQATSENNPNLKRLFSAIKKNENSDFFKLAQWIKSFKDNPYHLNI